MLIADQSLALHEAVQQMGYNSLEDFALVQAREKLLQEISICSRNIEQFEKKYGMDHADFCKTFHQVNKPFFEKEENSAQWNAELKQLNVLQKRLSRLA
ncbi:MAG: hypothetical protein WKG06_21470 [Segetibacter sp.]